MTQNDASRHVDQEDLVRRQLMSQPRFNLIHSGHTTRRVSLPADRLTSQEDRSSQVRQESVQIEDLGAEEETLYAPQNANWSFHGQFKDPVQGIERRPRIPAQEALPAREGQEAYSFLRPEVPRARPENPRPPRTEIPRQEAPRLVRSKTHPPRHREARAQRENDQQPSQAPGAQEQALRNRPQASARFNNSNSEPSS